MISVSHLKFESIKPLFTMINPIEYNQSQNQTNLNDFWFDQILSFQKLFGLTYRGSCQYSSKKLYVIKKVLLIIYEIITTAIVITALYNIFDEDVKSKSYVSTSKKGVLNLLFPLGSLSFMIEYIIYKITIFLNGPEIISIVHSLQIYSQSIRLVSKIKIYLYLICYLLIGIIAIMLSFNNLNSMIQDINDRNLKVVYYFIGGIFCIVTQKSVVIIMTITSELVAQELNELIVCVNNRGKFETICK